MDKKSERHFSAGPVDMQPYEMDLWEQMGDIAPHSLVVPHLLDWGVYTISGVVSGALTSTLSACFASNHNGIR